jgi:hypothetical protein
MNGKQKTAPAGRGWRTMGLVLTLAVALGAGCGGPSASGDGGTTDGSNVAAPLDVCALVSASQVAMILGTAVSTAQAASPGALDERGVAAPGCNYRGTQGVAVVYALGLTSWQGVRDAMSPSRSAPLAGVGDEAFVRREVDVMMPRVLEIGARKGNRNIHIRILQGATEAQASALATAFLP